jgi:hypothetical protein
MLTLSDPRGESIVKDIPAQLDSAADRTIVPGKLIQSLGLKASRVAEFEGLGGELVQLELYEISLSIQPLTAKLVEVAAHPNEPFVLLGRDVLNRYRVVHDGPRLVLEIS